MESTTSVQEQVREKYGSAARAVAESSSVQACCDPGLRCCDPITSNLYNTDQTGIIPEKAIKASLGCGNPTALIDLRPGEIVRGVPGSICTSGSETNWNKGSRTGHEARSIVRSTW